MRFHSLAALIADTLDPSRLLAQLQLENDPWQVDLLRSLPQRSLLLCARQTGKSTTTAVLALHQAIYKPGSLTLLLSPSQRQSAELLAKVTGLIGRLPTPPATTNESALGLTLANGSRVVALPGKESTVRGFSAVDLLVLDEAARVGDELYRSVRPMLAVSEGRLLALSTPFGQRGWFHDAWHSTEDWRRVRVTAYDCARIPPEFLEEERRSLGTRWFAQEYMCDWLDIDGAVFRTEDLDASLVHEVAPLFPIGCAR